MGMSIKRAKHSATLWCLQAPQMTREQCLARSAETRRAAKAATIMGGTKETVDFLEKAADELLAAARQKQQ